MTGIGINASLVAHTEMYTEASTPADSEIKIMMCRIGKRHRSINASFCRAVLEILPFIM